MVFPGRRNSRRTIEVRQRRLCALLFCFLDAAFDLPHRIQIIADLVAVSSADLPLQAGDIFRYRIENAATLPHFGKLVGRAAPLSKQAFEHDAWIRLRSKRGGW